MPGHGRGGRRERASSIVRWLGGFAVAGGLAAWEAYRAGAARATVPGGWGAGIAVGTGAGFALAALFAVTVRVRRRRPWASGGPQVVLLLVIVLLWFAAIVASSPPRQFVPHPAPYVVTSAVAVAEIAYVSTCMALCAVLLAVGGVLALVRGRRPFD